MIIDTKLEYIAYRDMNENLKVFFVNFFYE